MDRFSALFQNMTPYQYGSDNPILFIDINGDSVIPSNKVNWPTFDVVNNQILLQEVTITPPPDMSLSDMGLIFIQSHEGFGRNGKNPYNDSKGYATVGYGHLLHKSPVNANDKAKYKNFTQVDGLTLLQRDLERLEPQIRASIIVP